jgi:hypothetical protein
VTYHHEGRAIAFGLSCDPAGSCDVALHGELARLAYNAGFDCVTLVDDDTVCVQAVFSSRTFDVCRWAGGCSPVPEPVRARACPCAVPFFSLGRAVWGPCTPSRPLHVCMLRNDWGSQPANPSSFRWWRNVWECGNVGGDPLQLRLSDP